MRGLGRLRQESSSLWNRSAGWRRTLWQHWHNPGGKSVPVFLVGCGRSGTNMVIRRLGSSWQVDVYNEDHPAAFENYHLRRLDHIKHLVEKSRASIVLFKPILDTYLSTHLLARFASAKSIFTFRHYNDVINSGMKRFGDEQWLRHITAWVEDDFADFPVVSPPDESKQFIRSRWKPTLDAASGAALYWLFANRLYYDLKLHECTRVQLSQYEAFVTNPRGELDTLCRFLGIRFEPCMAERVSAASINRDPPPVIDEAIQADCEALWKYLCADAAQQRTVTTAMVAQQAHESSH